jgi:hypothetical protein
MRQSSEIEGIILGSVDRLSRDPYDGGAVCREALRNKLRLFFAAEHLDAGKESDQDRITSALQGARAYVNRLKRNTIPARKARADDGKIPNGQVPWPFDYDQGTGIATPNPVRAKWVRRWAETLAGGGTLGAIDQLMQENGVPAPKGGDRWGRSTIVRILRNKALKGEFQAEYERMEAPSFYEKSGRVKSTPRLVYADKDHAILTDEEWSKIQGILDNNRVLSRRNTKIDYTPLQGLVWCHCGKKAAGYPVHGYPYFRCQACRRPRVNAKKLWDQVKKDMAHVLSNPERMMPVLEEQLADGQVEKELRAKIDVLVAELQGLDEAETRALRSYIILPGIGEEKAKREIGRISSRKLKVEADLANFRDNLDNLEEIDISLCRVEMLAERFWQMLRGATDQEWRGLLREFGVKLILQAEAPHILRTRIRLTAGNIVLRRS